MWVVDTCVILDVLKGDHDFSEMSADALDGKRPEGLTIAPISYVELAPSFDGNFIDQNMFLSELGVAVEFHGDKSVVLKAYKAWYEHIIRKRARQVAKRPIADVMIGAYAMQKGGLITRNEDDFRTLYPNLTIFNPTKQ